MADFNRELTLAIPHLRRYARALLRERELADDLVQDCLERACSRRNLWNSAQPIRPWLFTIMHNIFVNDARRYHRAPALVSIHQLEDFGTSQADAETDAILGDLQSALERLSSDHREILLLVGLQQMSYRETAEILDIPVGTVMSRLTRARQNLKQTMRQPASARVRRVK